MTKLEEVILVDAHDNQIGQMEKIEAHKKGLLHRAFSVFLFNDSNEMLIQQRALTKYHSPGLWTNTCCSHPRPTESNIDAANRRLKEEMGIQTNLKHIYTFTYRTDFENGLAEHEVDHVFVGFTNAIPKLNDQEVMDYRYISIEKLEQELLDHPEKFTSWFKICIKHVLEKLKLESI